MTKSAFERPLPHALEAERAVLGGILVNNELLDRTLDAGLKAGDFFLHGNGKLYRIAEEMFLAGQGVDHLTLAEEARKRGELEACGGEAYIAGLGDGMPRIMNIRQYAGIVREKSRLRSLVHLGMALSGQALDGADAPREVIERAEGALAEMGEDDPGANEALSLAEAVDASLPALERIYAGKGVMTGLETGYPQLDRLTAGWQEKELAILAARPSVGKTALGCEFILRAAKRGVPCWIVTLEMTRLQIVLRLAALMAWVSLHAARMGQLKKAERDRLTRGVAELRLLPIWISEPTRLRSTELLRRARRMRERHGVKLTLLDYLQLVEAPGETAYERTSTVSRHAKQAAKIGGGTLVACAQLNRGAANEEPQLHHLRDSGQLEQDADVVMSLWNEEKYAAESATQKKILKVGKQRQGPVASLGLMFESRWMGFAERKKPPAFFSSEVFQSSKEFD